MNAFQYKIDIEEIATCKTAKKQNELIRKYTNLLPSTYKKEGIMGGKYIYKCVSRLITEWRSIVPPIREVTTKITSYHKTLLTHMMADKTTTREEYLDVFEFCTTLAPSTLQVDSIRNLAISFGEDTNPFKMRYMLRQSAGFANINALMDGNGLIPYLRGADEVDESAKVTGITQPRQVLEIEYLKLHMPEKIHYTIIEDILDNCYEYAATVKDKSLLEIPLFKQLEQVKDLLTAVETRTKRVLSECL